VCKWVTARSAIAKLTWMRILVVMVLAAGLPTVVAPQRAMAATCVWTGNTNSDWTATGNWSNCQGGGGTAPPISGDNVSIPDSRDRQPTIGASTTVNLGTGTLSVGNNSGNGVTLTVNGSLTAGAVAVTRPGNDGTTSIAVGSGSLTASSLDIIGGGGNVRLASVTVSTGTVTVSGDVAFTASVNSTATFVFSGAGTLRVGGKLTKDYAGQILPGTTSTVDFNGSAPQTINAPAFGTFGYANVTVTNNAGVTLGSSFDPTGNVTVVSGTLNNGGYNITLRPGKNFAVHGTSTFNLTGISTMVTVSGGGTKTFASGSTVNYGGTDQAVSAETYGNLTISGSGTKTLSGGVTAAGNVTIGSGTTLVTANNNINVAGNWTNNGAFTPSAGTVTFNGAAAQTISGANNFNNLTINNTNADAPLKKVDASGSTLVVNGLLHVLDGWFKSASSFTDVTIASNGTLELNSDSTVSGNWTNNGGNFTPNNHKVTFTKSGTSTIGGTSATSFYDVQIGTAAGSATTLDVSTNPMFDATHSVNNLGKLKQEKSAPAATTTEFLHTSSNTYDGVDITPDSDMGSTIVTIDGNDTCPAGWGESRPVFGGTMILRCFNITPTTSNTGATVRFWYGSGTDNDESGGISPLSEINIYRWQPPQPADPYYGIWKLQGRTSFGTDGDFGYVDVLTASDQYGEFTGGQPGENLITLASFTATPQGDGILVAWETASEIDNAGFDLWRSEEERGDYHKINPALIPAKGGPAFGAAYQFTDDTVKRGETYFFKLEDVDTHGVSTFHGPVSATAGEERPGPRLWTPLIAR
jgi:hypothetical protein